MQKKLEAVSKGETSFKEKTMRSMEKQSELPSMLTFIFGEKTAAKTKFMNSNIIPLLIELAFDAPNENRQKKIEDELVNEILLQDEYTINKLEQCFDGIKYFFKTYGGAQGGIIWPNIEKLLKKYEINAAMTNKNSKQNKQVDVNDNNKIVTTRIENQDQNKHDDIEFIYKALQLIESEKDNLKLSLKASDEHVYKQDKKLALNSVITSCENRDPSNAATLKNKLINCLREFAIASQADQLKSRRFLFGITLGKSQSGTFNAVNRILKALGQNEILLSTVEAFKTSRAVELAQRTLLLEPNKLNTFDSMERENSYNEKIKKAEMRIEELKKFQDVLYYHDQTGFSPVDKNFNEYVINIGKLQDFLNKKETPKFTSNQVTPLEIELNNLLDKLVKAYEAFEREQQNIVANTTKVLSEYKNKLKTRVNDDPDIEMCSDNYNSLSASQLND